MISFSKDNPLVQIKNNVEREYYSASIFNLEKNEISNGNLLFTKSESPQIGVDENGLSTSWKYTLSIWDENNTSGLAILQGELSENPEIKKVASLVPIA